MDNALFFTDELCIGCAAGIGLFLTEMYMLSTLQFTRYKRHWDIGTHCIAHTTLPLLPPLLIHSFICKSGSHSCSLLLPGKLCSFTGRRKEERRESLPCGNLTIDREMEDSRRPSFLKMVSLGKLKRESMSDKASQEAEEEEEEEVLEVKTREPLSGNNHWEWKV